MPQYNNLRTFFFAKKEIQYLYKSGPSQEHIVLKYNINRSTILHWMKHNFALEGFKCHAAYQSQHEGQV